jgi:hypothetical protein
MTLEWVEAQEQHHLNLMTFHQGKAASFAVIKQAILDVSAPEPSVGHETQTKPPPKPIINALNGTKKATILRAISGPPNGLVTQEIVSACINAGFTDTNQSNTSPQLSLYKAKGDIKLVDGRWQITDKGRAYLNAPKN